MAALGWQRLGLVASPGGGAWLARLGLERELKQRPLQTLCVIRASPVPSALKSYGLGVATDVRLGHFALACVAINTPYSIGWAFAGSSASSLHCRRRPSIHPSSAEAAQSGRRGARGRLRHHAARDERAGAAGSDLGEGAR